MHQVALFTEDEEILYRMIAWLEKNHHFKVSSSFILGNNNEAFLNWIVMCDEKWILNDYQWRSAQWLDPEEAPKHFPKLNLYQK